METLFRRLWLLIALAPTPCKVITCPPPTFFYFGIDRKVKQAQIKSTNSEHNTQHSSFFLVVFGALLFELSSKTVYLSVALAVFSLI